MFFGNQVNLEIHPKSIRASKKPAPVQVEFAKEGGICETKEGDVPYKAGDVIMTGVEGEQWPIERVKFAASYEAIPPIKHGNDGQYCKKPIQVLALQMDEPFYVHVSWSGSRLEGEAGDFLLQYSPNDYGIVSESIFEKTYEIIE